MTPKHIPYRNATHEHHNNTICTNMYANTRAYNCNTREYDEHTPKNDTPPLVRAQLNSWEARENKLFPCLFCYIKSARALRTVRTLWNVIYAQFHFTCVIEKLFPVSLLKSKEYHWTQQKNQISKLHEKLFFVCLFCSIIKRSLWGVEMGGMWHVIFIELEAVAQ